MSERDDQQLDRLLNRWKVESIPQPDLATQVWRRLAVSGQQGWHFNPVEWLNGFSANFLFRPAAAAAVLAIALLGGIGVAEWRLSQHASTDPAQWEQVYLTSINPAAHAGNFTAAHTPQGSAR